jgi:hypothetical protein
VNTKDSALRMRQSIRQNSNRQSHSWSNRGSRRHHTRKKTRQWTNVVFVSSGELIWIAPPYGTETVRSAKKALRTITQKNVNLIIASQMIGEILAIGWGGGKQSNLKQEPEKCSDCLKVRNAILLKGHPNWSETTQKNVQRFDVK